MASEWKTRCLKMWYEEQEVPNLYSAASVIGGARVHQRSERQQARDDRKYKETNKRNMRGVQKEAPQDLINNTVFLAFYLGGQVFISRGGGGGVIEPSGRTPPKKGSIDRTPKILLRLTPGPRR